MFPLSEGTENTTASHALATKSWRFRATAMIHRRARPGESPFRNASYVRKAANCLESEAFAGRPKEMIPAPLNSCLELWFKEAWGQTTLRSWILCDSSPRWLMIPTLSILSGLNMIRLHYRYSK